MWYKFVVDAGESYKDGGCAEYRDEDYHNDSCVELQKHFPEFVSIKYKEDNSKNMKGKMLARSQVQWKGLSCFSSRELEVSSQYAF